METLVKNTKTQAKVKITPEYQHFLDVTSELQKSEWIDGKLVVHSPSIKRHITVTKRLVKLMDSHADRYDLGYVATEKALINLKTGEQNYEPDIVFFTKEKTKTMTPTTSMFDAPDFVVEVLSKSTEKRDRGVKFDNYEKYGVSEYWIISAKMETIEQYFLVNGKYKLLNIHEIGDYIESKTLSKFLIPVRAIFDTYINLAELDRPIRQIFEAKIKEKDKKIILNEIIIEEKEIIIEEKEKKIEEKEKKIEENEKQIEKNKKQLISSIKFMKKKGATIDEIMQVTNHTKEFIEKHVK